MGEAAAAAEGLLHRRIEFRAATKPPSPAAAASVAVPGGFRMERSLFVGAKKRVAAAGSGREGRRFENGESSGGGFDPELSAARIYLRRIGAGLHNLGNTCYLNSVLQCLTYTEPFVAYLQSSKHESSCRASGFCALCALQDHVTSALRSTGKILSPMLFVKNLRCISRSFRNSRQEDAHELMVSLLESMHKCCLPSGIPSESPSAYEMSLVHRIFGGRLRSQVRCTSCSHCSNKFDPFLDLSLEIGNATTLLKALDNFTKEELLDGGEKHYNCQQCKQKVAAKKRFLIDKAPSVLTIHLKRFSPFNPLQKIDKKVDFPTTLNLKPFVSDSEGTDFKYRLYGVLVHAGWNTQSGHYYCFVRTSSGLWHNLDDNQVRQVREADVLRQKAYMLFYVRNKVKGSVIKKDNGAASLSEKEIISEKVVCMNGASRNGSMEKTMGVSTIAKEDMKLRKHDPDNGQPSDISAISLDQGSNEHRYIEVNNASASQNSEPVQKDPQQLPDGVDTLSTKAEQITLGVQRETTSPGQLDVCVVDMKSQKLNPDDGQPSNISASLQDQCSNEHESTEVTKASTSQSNGPVQKATCSHLDGTATFSTKTGQTALASQSETMSTAQPDACILCDESSDQKAYEKPLQELQLEPDGALTDSGKDIPAAFQLCNVADGLLGTNKQANEPRTEAFCQPTPDSDTTTIASVIPTEDTAVSNGTVTGNEDSINVNEGKGTEPVKQHHDPIVVKELSVKSIDDKAKAEEQNATRSNSLGNRQSMVKEVAVMETGHMADADDQTSVQINSLDTGHVNCETIIGSEDSAHVASFEDCAQIQMYNKKQNVGNSCAAGLTLGNKASKDATLDGAELASSCPSSVSNPDSGKCGGADEKGSWHFNLLTRGLRVPRWDDDDMPNTKVADLQHSSSTSIGYVLNEWDEEYDRGKRKKVRKSNRDFSGPNPFQEMENIRSRQRRRLQTDQVRSGHQPLRI
ncbi:unnamed protein product [Urochloa humidicola]